MGMYDEIFVKQDLPLPDEILNLKDWKNYAFQTKDLDNCLSEYIINEYRELVEVVKEREYIPYTEEEKRVNKLSPWNIWKETKETITSYRNTNHHGIIIFYTYDSIDEETDFWVDFKATFTHGKLENIILLEYKIDKERKKKNKEFFENFAKKQKHPWVLFKKYASFLGWRWCWRKIAFLLYSGSIFLDKIRNLILKYLL
jgi:hypothetical protein